MGGKRGTCSKCGLTFAAGAPHQMFCRGRVPEGATCVSCKCDDHDSLKECPTCGETICDCCDEDGTHVCD